MPPKRKRAAPARTKTQRTSTKTTKTIPKDAHQQVTEEGFEDETSEHGKECKRQKLTASRSEQSQAADKGESVVDGQSNEEQNPAEEEDDHDGNSKTAKGKPSVNKAYPKLLQGALKSKEALCANRRGIVPLHCTTKPIIGRSEMIKQRRLGLSYKQIGRKLGIDPHKEDVMQVYTALGVDIEQVNGPAKVTPPTPLWYLFDSEREIIKNCALPSTADVLQLLPQERVCHRLGDNSGFLLATYLKVAKIIDEEVQISLAGAPTKSNIGELQQWDDGLSGALIHQSANVHLAVGRAAYQLSDYCVAPEIGRCKCSAIKNLRYGWHATPIPHPSFFWGCCRYSIADAGMHDKGVPVRDSLWNIVDADDKIGRVSDRDLTLLAQKVNTAMLFWKDEPDQSDTLFEHASKFYGGPETTLPYKSKKTIIKALQEIYECLQNLSKERNDSGNKT